jgi:hypothetical protein
MEPEGAASRGGSSPSGVVPAPRLAPSRGSLPQPLLDHLIRPLQERLRDRQAEGLRRLEEEAEEGEEDAREDTGAHLSPASYLRSSIVSSQVTIFFVVT